MKSRRALRRSNGEATSVQPVLEGPVEAREKRKMERAPSLESEQKKHAGHDADDDADSAGRLRMGSIARERMCEVREASSGSMALSDDKLEQSSCHETDAQSILE